MKKNKPTAVKADYVLVYSDDPKFKNVCSACKKIQCECKDIIEINPKDIILKLRVEKNNRGGKVVTVIYEVPHSPKYFEELLKKLKALCGAGGTRKEATLEIQGDHKEKIKEFLIKTGFRVKG